MLSTVLLLGLTLVAAVTDVRWNKIFNWNTYSGMLAGLAVSAIGSVWLSVDGGAADSRIWQFFYFPRSPLGLESLGGLATCGLLMIASFVVFPGIGGGDVKLMAMIGSLLGTYDGLVALLWTFVLGSVFSLSILVWKVGPVTTVSRVARLLGSKVRPLWFRPLDDEERAALKPPIFLAPSALAATVIVRFGLIEMLEKVLESGT